MSLDASPQHAASARLLLTPSEVASALGVGRTTVYELMGSGVLPSIRIGRSRRVRTDVLGAFVAALGDDAAVR